MKNNRYYMRSSEVVVVTTGNGLLLMGPGDMFLEQATADAERWSGLMQTLASPATTRAVESAAASLAEEDREFLNRLIAEGFILEATRAAQLRSVRDRVFSENRGYHMVPQEPVCRHLIIGCTGSIVAGLMAPVLLSFFGSNFQDRLDVVLTAAARKFLTRDLVESYGIRTWMDGFERQDDIYVSHVHLGRSADCILVIPASANSLNRIAHGACTDLLSALITVTSAPVVVAPAMNEAMWNNRAIQRNLRLLRGDGVYVIEPTIIFGAADMAHHQTPMYGGHGTIWTGPHALMQTLSRILSTHAT